MRIQGIVFNINETSFPRLSRKILKNISKRIYTRYRFIPSPGIAMNHTYREIL